MSNIILDVQSDGKVLINSTELCKLLEDVIKFHTNYQDDTMSESFNRYHSGAAAALKFHLNSIKMDIKQVAESKETIKKD